MELELTEEQIRVKELQERFDKLNHPFEDLKYCNEYRANLKYFRNVELPELENADELLSRLEEIDILHTAQHQERVEKIARRQKGQQIRKLTHALIDIVIGYNIENGLQLSDEYPEIAEEVMGYHPFRAKKLIEAIESDDSLVNKMKNELLEVYNG